MRVVFTIAGLHPESGGPARSVPALCAALGQQGLRIEIVAHHYGPTAGLPVIPQGPNVVVDFVPCGKPWERRLQWSPHFTSRLRARCLEMPPELIHDTGLWLSTNRAAARVAQERKLPRVVSPRGMLSGWALQHKGWKKRLAWRLYQRRDLAAADLLHATAAAEAEEFRRLGLRQPIAMIPNGVELPPPGLSLCGQAAGAKRTLLFLSRIHPKKGLLNLVSAWQQARVPNWRVIVAGGDEGGHLEEVRAAARQAGVLADFEFVGEVPGEARWALYRQADLFILPSHSENFGLVIAEALASGVPVITTTAVPWPGLIEKQCGWWVAPESQALAGALTEAMKILPSELTGMGQRGGEWVRADFSWTVAAARMGRAYAWLLGRADKPDFVV